MQKSFKPFEITGEHLIRIFRSKKFVINLGKLRKWKDEAEFRVEQVGHNRIFGISDVQYGDYDTTSGSVVLEPSKDIVPGNAMAFSKERFDAYVLIDLHSHPGKHVLPSFPKYGKGGDFYVPLDLRSEAIESQGLSIRPIMGVVISYKGGQDLLLVQESNNVLGVCAREELEERFKQFLFPPCNPENTYDVKNWIESTGYYKGGVVEIKRGKYVPKTLECLANFSFIPKVVDKDKYADCRDISKIEERERQGYPVLFEEEYGEN